MAFQAEETHAGTDVKPFRKQYRLFHATFAQFCYTGAQVAVAGAFINYVTETRVTSKGRTDSAGAARFLAGAQGTFTAGRFIGSALMKFVKPRMVFFVFMTMCIIFPTIVALGMRGLGKYSKRGSGFIVAGVAGGAVVPPLLFVASDAQGQPNYAGHAPTATAMVVPMAFFIAAWSYPFCVNFVPAYRNVADSFSTTDIGIANAHANDAEHQAGITDIEHSKSVTPAKLETVDVEKRV
jgi:FHS family L-fucose permease-like MFS transporter